MATDLISNCMMLQQTPQMLKNQGSTKETQWITWHSSSESSILCWITQCCKATWRNELERRGAGTHCGQLNESNAPHPTKISFHISRRYQFIFVYFSFENIILHTFLLMIIIIRCSRMFHVPGFIDGSYPIKNHQQKIEYKGLVKKYRGGGVGRSSSKCGG